MTDAKIGTNMAFELSTRSIIVDDIGCGSFNASVGTVKVKFTF